MYIDVPTLRRDGDRLATAADSLRPTTSDVTRRVTRNRKTSRRRDAAPSGLVSAPEQTIVPRNDLLLQLPAADQKALLADAEYIRWGVGDTLARTGDPISTAYFPDNGVISLVSEMTTGHQVAVGAVGAEGVIGLGPLFSVPHYLHRSVVLAESEGYRVRVDLFRRVFEESGRLRAVTLRHVGRRMAELTIAAACHRVHSHRQRLARWLLIATDKARQRSLPVTHETLAQMVGGPRHAVTVALNELRAKGAIVHLRGRVDILKRPILISEACECYAAEAHLVR